MTRKFTLPLSEKELGTLLCVMGEVKDRPAFQAADPKRKIELEKTIHRLTLRIEDLWPHAPAVIPEDCQGLKGHCTLDKGHRGPCVN